jgi:predicted N-acetyltransferase YhbS
MGEILGFAMILDNPHTFWLLRFAVSPELSEYNKVCKLLMKELKIIAKKREHNSIIVYADPEDGNLNQRYKDLGFTQSDVYRCYWTPTQKN